MISNPTATKKMYRLFNTINLGQCFMKIVYKLVSPFQFDKVNQLTFLSYQSSMSLN
jgi:hypothetical protein